MTTFIYGSSDDLIEIGGDLSEEFNVYGFDGYVVTSTGIVLDMKLGGDAEWLIAVKVGSPEQVTVIPPRGEDEGRDEDGVPGYSAKAILTEKPAWVALVPEREHLVR